TGAKFSQVVERVDARSMAVAPPEMKRIIPDCIHGLPRQIAGYAPRRHQPLAAELLDAGCTRTILAEIPRRVGTEMAIVPSDIGLRRTDALNQRRPEVGQAFSPGCVKRRGYLYHGSPE